LRRLPVIFTQKNSICALNAANFKG
jgi:hypothetical protein